MVGLPGTVQGALRCQGLSLFGVPPRTAAVLENRAGDQAGDQTGDPVQGLLTRRLPKPPWHINNLKFAHGEYKYEKEVLAPYSCNTTIFNGSFSRISRCTKS